MFTLTALRELMGDVSPDRGDPELVEELGVLVREGPERYRVRWHAAAPRRLAIPVDLDQGLRCAGTLH